MVKLRDSLSRFWRFLTEVSPHYWPYEEVSRARRPDNRKDAVLIRESGTNFRLTVVSLGKDIYLRDVAAFVIHAKEDRPQLKWLDNRRILIASECDEVALGTRASSWNSDKEGIVVVLK